MFVVLLLIVRFSWQALSLQTHSALPVMCDIPLADQAGFTYGGRTWQNYAGRWAAIEEELQNWVSRQHLSSFSVLDIGSNGGFFSVQTAGVFPQALVIGVEGSVGVGNGNQSAPGNLNATSLRETPSIQNHLKWIQKLELQNNVIANEVWDSNHVKGLARHGFSVDVMYLLSVFHWMDLYSRKSGQYASGSTYNVEDSVNFMANILSLARLHFIELNFPRPDLRSREWEELFLKKAMQRSGRKKTIKMIFEAEAFWTRRIFVIEDEDQLSTKDVPETLSYFKHVLPRRIKSLPAHQAPACK